MIWFGSGMSAASTAATAAREAATQAFAAFHGDGVGARPRGEPKLAIVFASASYEDVAGAARVVRSVVGDAQIIGGTSGACVIGDAHVASRGVSVVLLGGDGLEVESHAAPLGSATFVETVPEAEKVAQAADRAERRGFEHSSCLVFAPGMLDGEAIVAAVRKGAGPRIQLAGALTGDDLTFDRAKVFFGDELRDDCVVLTGLFTKTPIGIGARHGWVATGAVHTVTRADGLHLVELDDRPALDVWLEDVRRAGGTPPTNRDDIALYLANHYELGLADAGVPRPVIADDERELIARAPFAIRSDGAVRLSASVAEGTHVRVLRATPQGLLRASTEAATAAVARAGGRVAGALVLSCAGRFVALGESFAQEPAGIRQAIGAPVGGACVFGEIARNVRDVDAFFNTTAVVVAFAT